MPVIVYFGIILDEHISRYCRRSGRIFSIAVDSNDDLHISYYDDDGDGLKYAWCSSSCTTASSWSNTIGCKRFVIHKFVLSGFILTLPLTPMATCTLYTLIGPIAGFSTLPALRLALPIHLGVTVY